MNDNLEMLSRIKELTGMVLEGFIEGFIVVGFTNKEKAGPDRDIASVKAGKVPEGMTMFATPDVDPQSIADTFKHAFNELNRLKAEQEEHEKLAKHAADTAQGELDLIVSNFRKETPAAE